ncbi:Flp family type IVb pilin [Vibrio hepatarius]|uniref:Pilus assembly protein n=1 Tax=Vibrio hepatarius TaxID=171383 RepID=A0A0M0I0X2_9VIBR|nr:Flp family type IVb pilin [Vibrio hepatarius]KOO07553.1 pilus assembly protein [Vibrio hepatarius]
MYLNIMAKLYEFKLYLLELRDDQRGVTAVEYAIIAVAMSAIILAVFKNGALKQALVDAVDAVKTNIGTANQQGK